MTQRKNLEIDRLSFYSFHQNLPRLHPRLVLLICLKIPNCITHPLGGMSCVLSRMKHELDPVETLSVAIIASKASAAASVWWERIIWGMNIGFFLLSERDEVESSTRRRENERREQTFFWWVIHIANFLFVLINEHNWHDWNIFRRPPCDPSTYPNGSDSRRCCCHGRRAFCKTICTLRSKRTSRRSMKCCIYPSTGLSQLSGIAALLAGPTTWQSLRSSPTDSLPRTNNFQNPAAVFDALSGCIADRHECPSRTWSSVGPVESCCASTRPKWSAEEENVIPLINVIGPSSHVQWSLIRLLLQVEFRHGRYSSASLPVPRRNTQLECQP